MVTTPTREINICTKQPGKFTAIILHTFIWTYLVGAEAISHLWFGGSWIIDLMIIFSLILMLISKVQKVSGWSIKMTPAEIHLWVAAGMPEDIKTWKETIKLTEVA